MKKMISVILALLMLMLSLAGCGSTSPAAAADVWERGYPHGFDEAALIQEGCWVDDELIRPVPDPEQPVLMWLDRPVGAGETVTIKLRCRLKLPDCAGLFGRAGGVVRLMQALPVLAARLDGSWDTAGLAAYGDPQETGLSDVQVTADLPQGYRLVTGPEAGVNQLSLLIVPDGLVRADAEEMAGAIRKLADDRLVKAMSEATYAGFDEAGCSTETYVKKLVKAYEEE